MKNLSIFFFIYIKSLVYLKSEVKLTSYCPLEVFYSGFISCLWCSISAYLFSQDWQLIEHPHNLLGCGTHLLLLPVDVYFFIWWRFDCHIWWHFLKCCHWCPRQLFCRGFLQIFQMVRLFVRDVVSNTWNVCETSFYIGCQRRVLVCFLALHWSTDWDGLHSYAFTLRSCGEWCLDLKGMMGSTWINVAVHRIPNILVWIPSFLIPK